MRNKIWWFVYWRYSSIIWNLKLVRLESILIIIWYTVSLLNKNRGLSYESKEWINMKWKGNGKRETVLSWGSEYSAHSLKESIPSVESLCMHLFLTYSICARRPSQEHLEYSEQPLWDRRRFQPEYYLDLILAGEAYYWERMTGWPAAGVMTHFMESQAPLV